MKLDETFENVQEVSDARILAKPSKVASEIRELQFELMMNGFSYSELTNLPVPKMKWLCARFRKMRREENQRSEKY